jgi:TatD DNase family protein
MPALAPLVDIGINLAHDSFDVDRPDVLARATAAGVVHLIVTGSSLESSRAARVLANAQPALLSATAGVHPHHASGLVAADVPALRELLAAPGVVAAGECGLDYFRNLSPHADQERAFRLQVELAIAAGKPLFLHQRDAHDAFVAILREFGPALPRAVAHCFTGTLVEAEEYLAMGLFVGITGWICDERRGLHLREIVRRIPADRLMLETDGPYLLPRSLRPKPATRRNEPMYLAEICRVVAEARGETPMEVARATSRTAARFFGFELAGGADAM